MTMQWLKNLVGITAVGAFYVAVFTVIMGFISGWNPMVVWPMAAVASVLTLGATGVVILKMDLD